MGSETPLSSQSRSVALLHYSTRNLGDDIQTYAVRQWIDTDLSVDRDRLRELPRSCHLVLFGWLLHGGQWPPAPTFRPHPLAIHLTPSSQSRMAKHIDWWRPWAPIPCRDRATVAFFEKHGVAAEFEGCATLALRRWIAQQEGCAVFADAVATPRGLPTVHFPTLVRRTHRIAVKDCTNQSFRCRAAVEALEWYQRAELVVTSRLHVLLPCLAFGTPVLFVHGEVHTRPVNASRLRDYLPFVTVWDGKQQYRSGGPLPEATPPLDLIRRVTGRLQALRDLLTPPLATQSSSS